jgi:pantetheine-phosphate adenylyltransferase
MKKIAVFPGSFDPITIGHEEIVRRALPLFDEIIVAIGQNTSKASLFSLEKRMEWIESTFSDAAQVRVLAYEGLTIDFCRAHSANFILRGVRNGGDYEYERSIAHMNKALSPDIETVLLFSDLNAAAIHSTIIREIIKNKGDVSQFLPKNVNVYA